MMKRLLLSLAIIVSAFNVRATHLMGGEITWECLGPSAGGNAGKYIFTLKVYEDCRSPVTIGIGTQTIEVWGNPTVFNINVTDIPGSPFDLSPSNCGYNCGNAQALNAQGATHEHILRSAPVTLGNSSPGAAGWVFTWWSSARNCSIINIGANPCNHAMLIRSKMFSFNGQPASPCFDNSPAFAERPSSFICSGYEYTYNHTAFDRELDSLTYSWDVPLDIGGGAGVWPGIVIPFGAPLYSTNNQLPGNPSLDFLTGEVNYLPPVGTAGDYVTCVRVDAYKCNIKVAEIYRDIQVGLSAGCGLTATGTINLPPDLIDASPVGGTYSSKTDTIFAGDSVGFLINVQDFNFNVGPPVAIQNVTVEILGLALDSQYFAAPRTGCLRPPCATLNIPTPTSFPGPGTQFKMSWKTTCNHLTKKDGCVTLSNEYKFLIKAKDNYCPAPARRNATLTVVVKEPPVLLPPKLHCVSVDTVGHVTLNWEPPTPKDTFNTFYNYQILRAYTPNGPWVTIDSVFTNNVLTSYWQNTYVDLTANAQDTTYYYAMLTRCGCDSSLLSEDTSRVIATMNLNASFDTLTANTIATLQWNPMADTLPATAVGGGYYYIYRVDHANGDTVVFVDSLFADSAYVDSVFMCQYIDTLSGCLDSVTWRIGVPDSTGCISWSSFAGATYIPDTLVEPPVINCVSVLSNGNVTLNWSVPVAQDTGRIFGGYLIYRSDPSPGGPFTLVDSVLNKTTQSWTDVSANAYTGGPYYYFVTTLDSCGMIESDSSNMVTPMILTANMVGPNVVLNWNNLNYPPLNSSYQVWKKVASAPAFTFLANAVNTTTYSDPVTLCLDSVVYQIRLIHNLPDSCTSFSSIDGDSVVIPVPLIGTAEPRCTDVQANGDVILSWEIPVDTAGHFNSYKIYESTNAAGPFNTLIGTVTNYGTLGAQSFTHVGANANTQINYYTIVTSAGCNATTLFDSPQSDTIASMKLNVSNATVGFAVLTWNRPHVPPATGANANYTIWRSPTGLGAWTQRGTLPVGASTMIFNDTINQCNVAFEYKITLGNSLPCNSTSSVANDVFTYLGNVVASPTLRCVSVQPLSGAIDLKWSVPGGSLTNFNSYEIYQSNGGPYSQIATINASGTNTYTDATANGNAQAYNYYIKTKSGCTGNVSSPDSSFLNSIFLTTTNININSNPATAQLNWTPLPLAVGQHYDIWSDYNATNTPGDIGDAFNPPFNEDVRDCDTGLTHYIEVPYAPLNCVSKSNVTTGQFTYRGNVISAPTLHCTSVQPSGAIELTWTTPGGSLTNFNQYVIYQNVNSGPWAQIATVNTANPPAPPLPSYTDLTANGNIQTYGYYIKTKSGCTGNVFSSDSSWMNSIFLTTTNINTTSNPGIAQLTWNRLDPNTANTLPATAVQQYDIWSDYNPLNTAADIGDVFNIPLTFNEPINDCDTGLTHYIRVIDQNIACASKSNAVSKQFTHLGNVIPSPTLRCVSVQASGAIDLKWDIPGGSLTNFDSYEIYQSNGGPYSQIATINASGTNTYTDATANGNAQAYNYYIKTKSGCTGNVSSPDSSFLNSIFLTTTNININSNPATAQLNWTPLPLAVGQHYDIWSDYNATNTPGDIGDAFNPPFNEDVRDCDTGLTHYIEVPYAPLNCVSKSNVTTGQFTYLGNVVPAPTLHCTSVQPSGAVELTWTTPGGSLTNFNQYVIYQNVNSGPWAQIATVNTANPPAPPLPSYTDLTANGNIQTYGYYIKTKSGCTGNVFSSDSSWMNSIYLTTTDASPNTDPGIARLEWTRLDPVDPTTFPATAVHHYDIWSDYTNPAAPVDVNDDAGNFPLEYDELIHDCDTGLTHYIGVPDQTIACASKSNAVSKQFTYLGNVIPSPIIRCVSVTQPTGGIQVSWNNNINNYINFHSFELFKDGSPVSIASITNQNDSTYFDAGTNGNTASHNYYLTTISGCRGDTMSAPSDTLASLKLTVGNTNGTIANLSWNNMHEPNPINGATELFNIYKEYPAGTWTQIASNVAANQYHDTITICGDNINFYVEQFDATGNCYSLSSVAGDYFRDILNMDTVFLESVSVDPNDDQTVTLKWLPTHLGDVVFYKIFHQNSSGFWDSVGTVSKNFLTFSTINPAVDTKPQSYCVISEDSCGNKSIVGLYPHKTVYSTAEMDICRGAIDIRWTPYLNMPQGIKQYDVYVNNALAGSVSSNQLLYSDTNLVNQTIYCYYVNAVGNAIGREASSNSACDTAELLTLPKFSYLNKASVIDIRRVTVEALVDTAGGVDISKFKIQRSVNRMGPFYTIGYVNFNGQPRFSYLDNTAQTGEMSYFYRVITVDSCGNDVLISNVGRTIFLAGQPNFNLTNRINWNEYEEWLGGTNNYSIFRAIDGTWDNVTPIASPLFGINEYLDNITEIYQTTGRFCYKIAAYEGSGNTYGFTDTSYSNEFCLVQEPHLFIPNAFTPEGSNPVFRPQFIYTDAKNYKFSVFNRWGEKIYETENPLDGWNGTIDGDKAPQGTYVYSVRLFGTNGQELNKSGRVTLLR